MIFAVIPWSSILASSTGPADYYVTHTVATAEPLWFELNWWFPQLAMLFLLASVLVGLVARMQEKEIVRLIAAGASDMMSPAMVLLSCMRWSSLSPAPRRPALPLRPCW